MTTRGNLAYGGLNFGPIITTLCIALSAAILRTVGGERGGTQFLASRAILPWLEMPPPLQQRQGAFH